MVVLWPRSGGSAPGSSCWVRTVCLQLLIWILCFVNGEEQPFSVEVRTGARRQAFISAERHDLFLLIGGFLMLTECLEEISVFMVDYYRVKPGSDSQHLTTESL